MTAQIIIPARLGSKRLPEKMLIEIEGKPLIWWTVKAAQLTRLPVMVATDSRRIADAVSCPVVLTGECLNGTERCIEAAKRRFKDGAPIPLIINWQGDSPMTRASWVHHLIEQMGKTQHAVGTLHQKVDRIALDGEVWTSYHEDAQTAAWERAPRGHHLMHRHVGVYAIKPEAFDLYGRVPAPRELQSQLEQKRWIDRGVAVASFEVEGPEAIEINTDLDIGLFKTCLESTSEAV